MHLPDRLLLVTTGVEAPARVPEVGLQILLVRRHREPVDSGAACRRCRQNARRLEDLMVFVNAIARLKGWIGPAPGRLFSGFCNVCQHPTIFAASGSR